MPTWSNAVPSDPRGHGLPLVRTPAARSLQAIVTSPDLIGCNTHFWGGHTVPCEHPKCDACQNGIAYRWHAYLSAYNPDDQLHFVFEMTAQAAQTFAAYRDEHNTLRGCLFEAYRWKHARNGRVIIKCTPSALHPAVLPVAPDLANVMSIIWRLPAPNVNITGETKNCPKVNAHSGNDGQSADPRLYAEPNP